MTEKQLPLVLFDIDGTLFDTTRMGTLTRAALAETLAITPEDIASVWSEYVATLPERTDFIPEEFLRLLSQAYQTSLSQLEAVFFAPEHFQPAIFPEVIEVLATLRNEGHQQGLYSQGHRPWQEHKLQSGNALAFFDPAHQYILKRKMDPQVITELPAGTVIVDDKPAVTDFLAQFPHIIALLIAREPQTPTEGTLKNLTELLPILAELRSQA